MLQVDQIYGAGPLSVSSSYSLSTITSTISTPAISSSLYTTTTTTNLELILLSAGEVALLFWPMHCNV